MPQLQTLPLPPLFLTEVIDKCLADHTHTHDEYCAEDVEFCSRITQENESLMTPVVVKIEAGAGRHVCDSTCRTDFPGCMTSCQDSDWVVTLQYSSQGYQAVYGVMKAGDVQDVSCWID